VVILFQAGLAAVTSVMLERCASHNFSPFCQAGPLESILKKL